MQNRHVFFIFSSSIETIFGAAKKGNIELVHKLLADKNVLIDQTSPFGTTTPLMQAATHGHLKVVSLLLDHGASINKQCYEETALTCAIKNNHEKIVHELLKRGANPLLKDHSGQDALALAKTKQNESILCIIEDYIQVQQKQQTVTTFFSNQPEQPGFFVPNTLVNIVKEYMAPELIATQTQAPDREVKMPPQKMRAC